ncbi:MAG: choice-of-anchor J domain-containing protein, partial [Muribaculaceae bacterium]|nr:choice-of-anchor J domain-containing protein [Muribaculaceae bacterium]
FAKGNFENFTIVDANNDGVVWKYGKNFDEIDAAHIDTQGVSTDDWLFLPAIALDDEHLYKLETTIHGTSFNYNECAEYYIGTAPTAEAMTTKVIEIVDMLNSRQNPMTTSGTFSVPETGTYYIGIHASSGYKRYGIFVLNVTLTADRTLVTPDKVENLTVNPDMHGELKGTIDFTAPKNDITGKALSGTIDILVKRDGELIETIEGVTPGKEMSVEDAPTAGMHTYTVVARGSAGEGISSEASAYFGYDLPKAPASITVKETETLGKVDVSWEPVTMDVNGKILPEGEVTYKLYGPGGTVVVSKLHDTKYTATATKGTQMFANYGVTAITEKGEGEEFIISEIIPVGNPYTLPWKETCSQEGFSSLIRIDDLGGYMRFGVYSSEETELEDADGSGYYLIGRGYDPNEKCRIYTGKINLADAEFPSLSFAYFSIPGSGNTIEVLVYDGTEWKSVKTVTIDGKDSEWVDAYVDLSAYKGKTIQLAFETTVVTHYSIAMDNLRVNDRPATDMKLVSFTAPESIKIGVPGTFSAVVENMGGKPNSAYTVSLYRNNEKIDEKAVTTALNPGDQATVGFTDNIDVTSAEKNHYMVEVTTDGDNDESDNRSEQVEVAAIQPVYPYVTSLEGTEKDGTVTLQWDEPDMETMVFEPIVESFENADKFAINDVAGWSFIDGDGSKTYALEDFEFPNQYSEMAAIVIPSSFFSGWKNFDAHSGGQLLASFSAVNGPNNDWMISPELIGDEQTVSFFAKSMSQVYPDSFEFYYSTSGKEEKDFIQMGEAVEAPHDWTEYSYDLPEGAKYFAIRYISGDGFVFMIDDAKFIPESARTLMNELALVGYNVYRDNKLLNEEPVEEPEFEDKTAPAGKHEYRVSAVYLQGESRLGNSVELDLSESAVLEIEVSDSADTVYYDLSGVKVEHPQSGSIYI